MREIKRGSKVQYTAAGVGTSLFEKTASVLDIQIGRGIAVAEILFESGQRLNVPTSKLALVTKKEGEAGVVVAKAPNPRQHKSGVMNKTEARYETEYLLPLKAATKIEDYFFEEVTFKLAHDCRYTPDFMVVQTNPWENERVEFHEVKATWGGKPHWTDDAKVKMQAFAKRYPFRLIVAYEVDGKWLHHDIHP